jgi:mycofactocin precursor
VAGRPTGEITMPLSSATSPTEVVVEAVDPVDVAASAPPAKEDLVADELLVEDVSIDGMCGVY